MIDVHCHLAFPGLVEIVDKVLADAKNSMKLIVTSGLSRDYEKSIEISKGYEGLVFLSLGIHPEDVVKMEDGEVEKSIEFIRNNADKAVAIGEIGLDYNWVTDAKQIHRCKKIFESCLDVAEEFSMPVILHSRKAEEDVFAIVSQRKFPAVVFHHYSGNMTLAKEIIEKGFYISLPTTTPNSKNLKKIARSFPLENLLTETDAPFNSPEKGKPNVPQNVKYTLELLASLRNASKEEIGKIIDKNGKQIFGIS